MPVVLLTLAPVATRQRMLKSTKGAASGFAGVKPYRIPWTNDTCVTLACMISSPPGPVKARPAPALPVWWAFGWRLTSPPCPFPARFPVKTRNSPGWQGGQW